MVFGEEAAWLDGRAAGLRDAIELIEAEQCCTSPDCCTNKHVNNLIANLRIEVKK